MTGLMSALKGCTMPNVYAKVPDGGWGWVVAVAFFFVEVFTYGIIKIFGIFLQDLMNCFGETNSRVSWAVSICVFVMAFTGNSVLKMQYDSKGYASQWLDKATVKATRKINVSYTLPFMFSWHNVGNLTSGQDISVFILC